MNFEDVEERDGTLEDWDQDSFLHAGTQESVYRGMLGHPPESKQLGL